MESTMQKVKYEYDLNLENPTLKMESVGEKNVPREWNLNRDTNGTSLSYSAGTISPNVQ